MVGGYRQKTINTFNDDKQSILQEAKNTLKEIHSKHQARMDALEKDMERLELECSKVREPPVVLMDLKEKQTRMDRRMSENNLIHWSPVANSIKERPELANKKKSSTSTNRNPNQQNQVKNKINKAKGLSKLKTTVNAITKKLKGQGTVRRKAAISKQPSPRKGAKKGKKGKKVPLVRENDLAVLGDPQSKSDMKMIMDMSKDLQIEDGTVTTVTDTTKKKNKRDKREIREKSATIARAAKYKDHKREKSPAPGKGKRSEHSRDSRGESPVPAPRKEDRKREKEDPSPTPPEKEPKQSVKKQKSNNDLQKPTVPNKTAKHTKTSDATKVESAKKSATSKSLTT